MQDVGVVASNSSICTTVHKCTLGALVLHVVGQATDVESKNKQWVWGLVVLLVNVVSRGVWLCW